MPGQFSAADEDKPQGGGKFSAADEDKAAPGFLDTLGSDAMGVLHALRHPVQAAYSMAQDSTAHAAKAIEGVKEGDARKVYDNAYQAVPGLGPMLWGIAQDLVAGNHGRAAARLAELAVPEVAGEYGPKITETVSKIPGAVKDLVQTPGTAKIIGGAASAGAGMATAAASAAHMNPLGVLEGGAATAYGATKLSEGLAARKTFKANVSQAAADQTARDAAEANYQRIRASQPVVPVEPVAQPAPGDATPIMPADRTLPSGRVVPIPGTPPNPISSALDMAKLRFANRQAENTGAAPAVPTAPPAVPAAATEESTAAVAPSVSPQPAQPLTAAQELAQSLTGKPEGGEILFSKPAADPEAMAAKARTARAPKVAALKDYLAQQGVTAEKIDAIRPGMWRDIADALKIDLPKDLTTTIRDVKAALSKPAAPEMVWDPARGHVYKSTGTAMPPN